MEDDSSGLYGSSFVGDDFLVVAVVGGREADDGLVIASRLVDCCVEVVMGRFLVRVVDFLNAAISSLSFVECFGMTALKVRCWAGRSLLICSSSESLERTPPSEQVFSNFSAAVLDPDLEDSRDKTITFDSCFCGEIFDATALSRPSIMDSKSPSPDDFSAASVKTDSRLMMRVSTAVWLVPPPSCCDLSVPSESADNDAFLILNLMSFMEAVHSAGNTVFPLGLGFVVHVR